MKILLTGGTGGLGREAVRAAESGDDVREALEGADAVIHAASDPRRHALVDVEGTPGGGRPRRPAPHTRSTSPS